MADLSSSEGGVKTRMDIGRCQCCKEYILSQSAFDERSPQLCLMVLAYSSDELGLRDLCPAAEGVLKPKSASQPEVAGFQSGVTTEANSSSLAATDR